MRQLCTAILIPAALPIVSVIECALAGEGSGGLSTSPALPSLEILTSQRIKHL